MKTGNSTLLCSDSMEILTLPNTSAISSESRNQEPSWFELIWITNRKSNHWIDLQKREVGSNQILCIVPGQIHKFDKTDNLAGYIIRFQRSFLEKTIQPLDMPATIGLLQLCSNSNGVEVKEELIPQLTKIIEVMIAELCNTVLHDNEMVKRYFEIFLIHLTRQMTEKFNTAVKTRNTELVEEFTELLEKHFKEKKMVSEYAARLSITPNYLNEIVKKMTGHSAGHLIRQRIALEAKRQALYSGLCMKEVAYKLGFSDIAHFSKFFKSNTGANFSDFKKTRLTFLLPSPV